MPLKSPPGRPATAVPTTALRLAVALAGLWLLWPLMRPRLWPAAGGPLVVVLDGYHRLPTAWALQRQRHSTVLLIACPTSFPYSNDPTELGAAPGPVRVLGQGYDTVGQMVALDRWLTTAPLQVNEVLLVSDRFHLRRAGLAAQLAIGSRGIRVTPVAAVSTVPLPQREPWRVVLRDGLRITAWRFSGSTLAFLRPEHRAWKRQGCLDHPLRPH